MTEEQKKHSEGAAKFAEALGAVEGAVKEIDGWQERDRKSLDSTLATNDAIRRGYEDEIVSRAREAARAERYEAQHQRTWERDAQRHEVWLAEVRHAQAHREREVLALERIADALGRKAH